MNKKVSKVGMTIAFALVAGGVVSFVACGSAAGIVAALGVAPVVALWSAAPAIERTVI
jgi:hypothetical protein